MYYMPLHAGQDANGMRYRMFWAKHRHGGFSASYRTSLSMRYRIRYRIMIRCFICFKFWVQVPNGLPWPALNLQICIQIAPSLAPCQCSSLANRGGCIEGCIGCINIQYTPIHAGCIGMYPNHCQWRMYWDVLQMLIHPIHPPIHRMYW